ncbi:MAG TPA: leucyl aminopeptidase [Mycobacteriales bacterium]
MPLVSVPGVPARRLPEIRSVAPRGRADVLVIPVTPGDGDDGPVLASTVPDDLAELLDAFLADAGHTGKAGSVHTLPRPTQAPSVVHLVGIGDGGEAAMRAAGSAVTRAVSGRARASVALPDGLDPAAVRGLVEGLLLAAYRYTLADGAEPPKLRRIDLLTDDPDTVAAEADTARVVAEATWLARDLVNTPGLLKSPEWLAAAAVKAAAAHGVTATVREPEQLAAEGFGGLLAVGGGSVRGPRLVELRWAPRGARRHVVLVGKGITFDTGGISIKPGPGMGLMKKDMGGAAAVLGTVLAAAALRLPVKVTALMPIAENMPSGSAYRPGDVIRHHGGKTSEVLNTDAEGRLVLADALAYASARLRPDALVDLATLTGAQSVALGKRTAALFSPSDALADALAAAADEAGERVWRMPLPEDYVAELRSDVADVNNAAGNPGAITAALYLREFTGDAADRWAHLDMSGPAWSDKADGELARGATGWGVRTLVRWLQGM